MAVELLRRDPLTGRGLFKLTNFQRGGPTVCHGCGLNILGCPQIKSPNKSRLFFRCTEPGANEADILRHAKCQEGFSGML